MKQNLKTLAYILQKYDSDSATKINILAGRYDKAPVASPPETQPAFKYIMYLKLMRGINDASFHYMKRKYLNTSIDIQQECQKELDKLIAEDTLTHQCSSAVIRQQFEEKLKHIPQELIQGL